MAERIIERFIFASRWLMAPFYLGLVVSLAMLLFKFLTQLYQDFRVLPGMRETDAVLMVLRLIDLSLAGNLVLMVIFSGYEGFVSRLHTEDHVDRPDWMGQLDFSGLKLRLLGSIVAISAIQLLAAFMDIQDENKTDVAWLLAIHLGFVVSAVLLALMDRLAADAHRAS